MSTRFIVEPTPRVTDAIETRRSVREFLPDPVPEDVVRSILTTASRSASGGNLQPWKVSVLGGEARDRFVASVAERSKETPFGDGPEYAIYPPDLQEPYKGRRGKVAADMYAILGIARDDSEGRMKQMTRNFDFFGAPVGIFIGTPKNMGSPQYCDLGIFLQSIMLLAREHGLHTCPQEAWSMWGKTIREFTHIGEDDVVFCGISLGYADPEAEINQLHTDRAGLDEFARFEGF
ncbi:MAG: nitroreductase [Myxococcota bacterium]|nr:nitroreductase [Myxococcota bacterium]